MGKIKRFFCILLEMFLDIPKPEGELRDQMSRAFYIDLYILVFVILIMIHPFQGYFGLFFILVLLASFIASARPFVRYQTLPAFTAFFNNRTKFGKVVMGYFLLLFFTFMVAFVHLKFLREMDLNYAVSKFFIGYYVVVFAILPIILSLVYFKIKIVSTVNRFRK